MGFDDPHGHGPARALAPILLIERRPIRPEPERHGDERPQAERPAEERAHRRGRAARFHDRQRRQLGQRHAIEQRPARRAAPTCRGHELTGVTHDS